jgi:cyclic pyranopterin phosphate synthase
LKRFTRLAESFVALGTRKIRLTGGEPLIRPGVVQLCEKIAALPGLRELCMTTNGSQLAKLAQPCSTPGSSASTSASTASIRNAFAN